MEVDENCELRFLLDLIADNLKVVLDFLGRLSTVDRMDGKILLGSVLQVLVETFFLLVELVVELKDVLLIIEILEELQIHLALDEI